VHFLSPIFRFYCVVYTTKYLLTYTGMFLRNRIRYNKIYVILRIVNQNGGRRGRDRMVVVFTVQSLPITTKSWEFEPRSWQGLLDTTLCDKVCQWLETGGWFSPSPPVSSTNKTDRHDITEILLKVALNTIKQTNNESKMNYRY